MQIKTPCYVKWCLLKLLVKQEILIAYLFSWIVAIYRVWKIYLLGYKQKNTREEIEYGVMDV